MLWNDGREEKDEVADDDNDNEAVVRVLALLDASGLKVAGTVWLLVLRKIDAGSLETSADEPLPPSPPKMVPRLADSNTEFTDILPVVAVDMLLVRRAGTLGGPIVDREGGRGYWWVDRFASASLQSTPVRSRKDWSLRNSLSLMGLAETRCCLYCGDINDGENSGCCAMMEVADRIPLPLVVAGDDSGVHT